MDAAPGARRQAGVIKHSMVIAGHRTSVSLEPAFWQALKDLAAQRRQSVAALVAAIDSGRGSSNLSSAIRVFVLEQVAQGQAAGPNTRRTDNEPAPPNQP
jgi:predicted DNA-binding ribbon-helix-helix protein